MFYFFKVIIKHIQHLILRFIDDSSTYLADG